MRKIKGIIRKMFSKTTIQDNSIILLNKELSDQVAELTDENIGVRDICDRLQRDILRQSGMRQQAESRADEFELLINREGSINDDATNERLIMQGVLYRAREVARDIVPLLLEANEALPSLPAPETERGQDAIATLNESLSKACRYANMIGNDGYETENENILITTGMMEERRKQTGESPMQSDEAEVLREFLSQHFRGVGVVDTRNKTRLLVQLYNNSINYSNHFNALFPPERILQQMKDELAAAQAEIREAKKKEKKDRRNQAIRP